VLFLQVVVMVGGGAARAQGMQCEGERSRQAVIISYKTKLFEADRAPQRYISHNVLC